MAETAETILSRRGLLKLGAAGGLGLAASGMLAACSKGSSSAAAGDGELRIMSYGGTMPDIVQKYAIDPFLKEFPDFAVDIEVATNSDIYPRLLADQNNPFLNAGMFNDSYDQNGLKDGMWAAFDMSLMSNASSEVEALQPAGDPRGLTLGIQSTGIAYNPDLVEAPTSWADLYKPEFEGRVVAVTGNYDIFIIAAILQGGATQDIELGINEWAKHSKNVGAWVNSPPQQLQLLEDGEMWLAPMYSSAVLTAIHQGSKVAWTVPEEGATPNTLIARVLAGFSEEETTSAQQLLNFMFTNDFQSHLVTERFLTPGIGGLEIPAEYLELGIMKPEEAGERLHKVDWAWLAENQAEIQEMVQRKVISA